LGKPLPDRSYADDCRVFTPGDARGSMGNIMDTLNDEFVVAHLLGWFGKVRGLFSFRCTKKITQTLVFVQALLFRDFWLATSLSVLFEIWEVTFAHQLPNFHECW
jgi:phosphatidylserine synthase 2